MTVLHHNSTLSTAVDLLKGFESQLRSARGYRFQAVASFEGATLKSGKHIPPGGAKSDHRNADWLRRSLQTVLRTTGTLSAQMISLFGGMEGKKQRARVKREGCSAKLAREKSGTDLVRTPGGGREEGERTDVFSLTARTKRSDAKSRQGCPKAKCLYR